MQGQAGGGPSLDPTDDVGRVHPERAKGDRGQRRAVALPAQHDDLGPGQRLGDAVRAGRVEPPLEDGAVDDERAGQLALPGPLRGGAGVDGVL